MGPRTVKIATLISTLILMLLLFHNFSVINAKILGKEKTAESMEGKMTRKMQALAGLMIGGQGSADALTLREYRELVFDAPRKHSTFVLFYNDRNICEACDGAVNVFERIAKSFASTFYTYDAHTATWNLQVPAFFVKVRMSHEYRHMLVDLDPTQPSIYYFAVSPTEKHNNFEQLHHEDFISDLNQASLRRILAWINEVAGIQFTVEKEEQTSGISSTLLTVCALGIMIVLNAIHFGYWDSLVEGVKQWNYAYTIVVMVIWLISGQMFNSIRYRPILGPHGFSLMSLVFPGSRNQYGVESFIIMMLYGLLIYGVIQLIELRERQLTENLPGNDIQKEAMTALTCVFFAFMVIQFLSQMKLRY